MLPVIEERTLRIRTFVWGKVIGRVNTNGKLDFLTSCFDSFFCSGCDFCVIFGESTCRTFWIIFDRQQCLIGVKVCLMIYLLLAWKWRENFVRERSSSEASLGSRERETFFGGERKSRVTIQTLIIQIYPPTLFSLSTKFIVFIKTTRNEWNNHENGNFVC